MNDPRILYVSTKHFNALRQLMGGEDADLAKVAELLDLQRSKSLENELAECIAQNTEADISKFCTAVKIDYAYVTYLAKSKINTGQSLGNSVSSVVREEQNQSSLRTRTLDAIQLSGADNLTERLANARKEREENDSQEIAFTKIANRYYREEPLGKGAFGSVFACEDSKNGNSVALKLLRVDSRSATAEARLLSISESNSDYYSMQNDREAILLACLQHPNVLACLDWGEESTNNYIVTEKCSTTVRELMRVGKIQLANAIQILMGVAEGLAFLHSQGVVHRDIKPDNILVDNNGWPRIADLGLAVFLHAGVSGIAGTIAYMSPEQINQLWFDGRSDVYSLGVMAYEMLTGHSAYGSIRGKELFFVVEAGALQFDITALSELPGEVVDIIKSCTQKLPTSRCTARELVSMLRDVQVSLVLDTTAKVPQDEISQLSTKLHSAPTGSKDQLDAYRMLGDAYYFREFHKTAICCWWRSAEIAIGLRNDAIAAEMMWLISQCCFKVGDIAKALLHGATALDLARNSDEVLASQISEKIALWPRQNDV